MFITLLAIATKRSIITVAMALSRAAGDRGRLVWLLNDLGVLYYALGDNQKARDTFEEGLLLARQIHYGVAEANLLSHVGSIHSV